MAQSVFTIYHFCKKVKNDIVSLFTFTLFSNNVMTLKYRSAM